MRLSMKHMFTFVVLIFLISSCTTSKKSKDQANVIPHPMQYLKKSGGFSITSDISVKCNSALLKIQEKDLTDFFQEYFSVEIKHAKNIGEANIKIYIDKHQNLGEEGYSLTIGKEEIVVKANTKVGIYYAIQTIKQMVEKEANGTLYLPCVDIVDSPAYKHRILRLDVSGKFMPVDEVKTIINHMAFVKMNRLILVVASDEHFRIAIPQYPLLNSDADKIYTRNDIVNIIHYAKQHNVMVVPEVNLFDRNCAISNNYRSLCDASSLDPEIEKTNFADQCYLNVFDPKVKTFTKKVFNEVVNLFGAKYLSLGKIYGLTIKGGYVDDLYAGSKLDELVTSYSKAQVKLIKDLDYDFYKKGVEFLFVDHGWKYSRRKNVVSVVESSTANTFVNLNKGMGVIEAPFTIYDLDRPQSKNSVSNTVVNMTTLKKVFQFTPDFCGDNIDSKGILGVCAFVNYERSPNVNVMTYKMFPRLFAIAETAWNGNRHKDWDRFLAKTKRLREIFKKIGIQYGEPSYEVTIYNNLTSEGTVLVHMQNEVGAPIYYTTDGSIPTKKSKVYTQPIEMSNSYKINACSFHPDGEISKVTKRTFKKHLALHKYIKVKYPFSKLKTSGGGMKITDGFFNYFQRVDLNDVDLTVDLGQKLPICKISTNWKIDYNRDVFMPASVAYYMSNDGINFDMVYYDVFKQDPTNWKRQVVNVSCFPNEKKARYVRVVGKNIRIVPKWHPDKGEYASLFIDELEVE